MNRKTLVALLLVIVLAGAGAAFWWLETSTRPVLEEPDTATKSVLAPPPLTPFEAGQPAPTKEAGLSSGAAAEDAGSGALAEKAPAIPSVGDILAEPGDDYAKIAKKLAALVANPEIALAEREEALAHAMNLSVGAEVDVLTPLVVDPKVPDALAETVLAEALNRPLGYQADLYLAALAARKSADMQTKIREHLSFLTNSEDKGGDPAAWKPAIEAARSTWPE